MSTKEDSSNKYINWFSRLTYVFLFAWIINLNKFVIIAGSILTFVYGVLLIWKPHIFPKDKLLFSEKRTDNFQIWSKRAFGILFLIISVIMIIGYRHNTLLYTYIACLFIFTWYSIWLAIKLILYSKEQRWIAKVFAWTLFLGFFISAVLAIGFFPAFLHSSHANNTYPTIAAIIFFDNSQSLHLCGSGPQEHDCQKKKARHEINKPESYPHDCFMVPSFSYSLDSRLDYHLVSSRKYSCINHGKRDRTLLGKELLFLSIHETAFPRNQKE